MEKRKAPRKFNTELLDEFLIANHNVQSCCEKMQELGRTDSLIELYDMFAQQYYEVREEILRRMDYGNPYKQD